VEINRVVWLPHALQNTGPCSRRTRLSVGVRKALRYFSRAAELDVLKAHGSIANGGQRARKIGL
jgi:hypothetical protein